MTGKIPVGAQLCHELVHMHEPLSYLLLPAHLSVYSYICDLYFVRRQVMAHCAVGLLLLGFPSLPRTV